MNWLGEEIHYLRRNQVAALFNADAHAWQLQAPPNLFVTVQFGEVELQRSDGPRYVGQPLRRAKAWLARRDVPFHCLYVHENPPGKGYNQHVLIHVPKTLQPNFIANLPGWWRVDVAAIDAKQRYGERLDVLRYMCKGTDWGTAGAFGIRGNNRAWKGNQGTIPFKRCGWSRALGNAAWQAGGDAA